MMKKIVLLFAICAAALFLQGCIGEQSRPGTQEPTPAETPVITPKLEKTPGPPEKIDCGTFSDFFASDEFDCYCKAFHECKPAVLNSTEFGSLGKIGLEIIGAQDGECRWKFTITSPEGETAYSECGMPTMPKELTHGQECVTEIITPSTQFANHENAEYCTGTLTESLSISCEEACKKTGYENGICNTPEAGAQLPGNVKCTNGSENYAGHLPSCMEENFAYPCCCYNGELKPLEGDLSVSGNLGVGYLFNGKAEAPFCFGEQDLYFDIKSTFPEGIEKVGVKVYIDGEEMDLGDYDFLRIDSAEFGATPWLIQPGKSLAYVKFNRSTAGHTIKVVMDPENFFKESDETNNSLEKTFSGEKMDLGYVSADPSGMFEKLEITIKRDKVVEYCPPFGLELYINGEPSKDFFFVGFMDGKLEGSIHGPKLEPGKHEIRLVIDRENVVEESDESNNDVTFTVEAQ